MVSKVTWCYVNLKPVQKYDAQIYDNRHQQTTIRGFWYLITMGAFITIMFSEWSAEMIF